MAIKVKAIERNVAFVKGEEKWAYVLQADLYSKLSDAKVIQEAALRSGINKGAGEVIYSVVPRRRLKTTALKLQKSILCAYDTACCHTAFFEEYY